MRAPARQLKRLQLCTGMRIPRIFLYLLLVPVFLAGYTSGIAHSYDHLADQQPEPELICQLCIAGDQFTPLSASAIPARHAYPHPVRASAHGAWPILITRHNPGTPRDPPATA